MFKTTLEYCGENKKEGLSPLKTIFIEDHNIHHEDQIVL